MLDIKAPLTDREAGKVKTNFEQKDIVIKLRYLIGFSPIGISLFSQVKRYGITPEQIAEAAGRVETQDYIPMGGKQ